jgi:hypothetical protein
VWSIEKQFKVIIGGNVYIDVPDLVVYNEKTLFALRRHDDNGQLGIYFELFDATGSHVASIKRNEIYRVEGMADRYKLSGSAKRMLARRSGYEAGHLSHQEESRKPYLVGSFR